VEWVNQPNPNCEVKKLLNSGLSCPFFRISYILVIVEYIGEKELEVFIAGSTC
jgi:hypothetical protein